MSFQSASAPRRLLQTHGAFVNATLTPRLRQRRAHGAGQNTLSIVKSRQPNAGVSATQLNKDKRVDELYGFSANDEIFDAREGEILLYSQKESGFPNSRRAVLFSSLNGIKTDGQTNPEDYILKDSDFHFVGLVQNGYISSNTALSSQGMAVQTSGIKTVQNLSGSTINIGDRLMAAPMTEPPSHRKGIPNEKVTMIFKKVSENYVPNKVREAVKASGKTAVDDVITETILQFRKAGRWVVGTAMNAARPNEQLDVLLTKPSFL